MIQWAPTLATRQSQVFHAGFTIDTASTYFGAITVYRINVGIPYPLSPNLQVITGILGTLVGAWISEVCNTQITMDFAIAYHRFHYSATFPI